MMIKFIQWFIAPLGYTVIENQDLEIDRRTSYIMLTRDEFDDIEHTGYRWRVTRRTGTEILLTLEH